MCNSKTKTALPVGAGKAVIETGIYMICVTKVPAPIIAQNEAFDQSFFLGKR